MECSLFWIAGGSYVEQNLAVMSMDARWVLYGLMGGAVIDNGNPFWAAAEKADSTQVHDSSSAIKDVQGGSGLKISAHALPMFADKRYRPILDQRRFNLNDAMAAHEYMASNANTGKIVLIVTDTPLQNCRSSLREEDGQNLEILKSCFSSLQV